MLSSSSRGSLLPSLLSRQLAAEIVARRCSRALMLSCSHAVMLSCSHAKTYGLLLSYSLTLLLMLLCVQTVVLPASFCNSREQTRSLIISLPVLACTGFENRALVEAKRPVLEIKLQGCAESIVNIDGWRLRGAQSMVNMHGWCFSAVKVSEDAPRRPQDHNIS